MDCDVFERYELKYRITKQQLEVLRTQLSPLMDRDAFGAHTVLSLYYDTPDYRVIRRSLEKPDFKQKLRLRCYGMPDAADEVFVELKSKCLGVVYKRRFAMPLNGASTFLEGGAGPDCQIARETSAFLGLYPGIRPSMLVCCEREAYFGCGAEKSLRVTFDADIRYRADRLDLTQGAHGFPLLGKNEVLMEVKLPGVMPLWLTHALSALRAYPSSFSKYGAAYGDFAAARENTIRREIVRCA